jgi:hypothetical protein
LVATPSADVVGNSGSRCKRATVAPFNQAGFVVDVLSHVAYVYQYDPKEAGGVARSKDELFGRTKTETLVKLQVLNAHSV